MRLKSRDSILFKLYAHAQGQDQLLAYERVVLLYSLFTLMILSMVCLRTETYSDSIKQDNWINFNIQFWTTTAIDEYTVVEVLKSA